MTPETQRALDPGSVSEVDYPFTRDDYSGHDEDGPFTAKTWRPGVRFEMCAPDDTEAVADGMGKMVLEIVSTHKPGRWPERVFYTRRWLDPTGKEFGNRRLRIATSQQFRRLANGYRHEYRVARAEKEGTP